jgi:hypothetical protein
MAMAVGGKLAGRVDTGGLMTGPCIVGAIVNTHLLGKPTAWVLAHNFWHALRKDEVTCMHRVTQFA